MPDARVLDLFVPGAAILGLVLGGFSTTCVHRFIVGQSLLSPGPHCPKCLAPLRWWETIPVLSFLILRGRCGHCRAFISPRYPALEILGMVWAVLLAWRLGPGLAWSILMIVGGIFLVAAFIDLELYILPDVLTVPGFFVGVAAGILALDRTVQDCLIGAVAGVGFFWLTRGIYRKARSTEGLGFGDVKLMAMIGALTGWRDLPLTILIAAGSSLLGCCFFKKPGQKTTEVRLPFGPFLCLGAMIAVMKRLYWG